MQIQHIAILIVALGLAGGLYLSVVYALTGAKSRHYRAGLIAGRLQARTENNALTLADLQTLVDISNTLRLAHSTWFPMPGTEPQRNRVVDQLAALHKIAIRVRNQGPHGTEGVIHPAALPIAKQEQTA
jgi:hypothetical protein